MLSVERRFDALQDFNHLSSIQIELRFLVRPPYRREELFYGSRGIPAFLGDATIVALTALLFRFFSEVSQKKVSAAFRAFSVALHYVLLHFGEVLIPVLGFTFRNAFLLKECIASAKTKPCFRLLTVSSGSSDFLDVVLNAFRQRGMCNETNIRLVNSHAEGNCRHNHGVPFMQETGLAQLPLLSAQPGMITKAINSFRCEKGTYRFRFSSRARVNDAAFSGMLFFDKGQKLFIAPLSADNSNSEIFSLKAGSMHIRFNQKFFTDIS